MSKLKPLVFLLTFGVCILQLACSQNSNNIIPCHKTAIEGKWNVVSDNFEFYEQIDSTVFSSHSYIINFNEDGRGNDEDGNGNFTWTLQCNPDHLLVNRLGRPFFEETGDDPMHYLAFTSIYVITKITEKEIQLEIEYFKGSDETRRRILREIVYTRVK